MKSFDLVYKIEPASSWRNKEAIKIKSNLADDPLIECELSKSLIEYLKTEAVVLEPDRFLLSIAEAQKREIQTSIEALDDMTLQAKINADKAHKALSNIAEDAEKKYEELEKRFSDIRKQFTDKLTSTANSIKEDLNKLSEVEEKLSKIDNWSLKKLTETLQQVVKIAESDAELMKLVLNYKKA